MNLMLTPLVGLIWLFVGLLIVNKLTAKPPDKKKRK